MSVPRAPAHARALAVMVLLCVPCVADTSADNRPAMSKQNLGAGYDVPDSCQTVANAQLSCNRQHVAGSGWHPNSGLRNGARTDVAGCCKRCEEASGCQVWELSSITDGACYLMSGNVDACLSSYTSATGKTIGSRPDSTAVWPTANPTPAPTPAPTPDSTPAPTPAPTPEPNVCTCSGGNPAVGTACTANNTNICDSCNSGLVLSETSCEAPSAVSCNGTSATFIWRDSDASTDNDGPTLPLSSTTILVEESTTICTAGLCKATVELVSGTLYTAWWAKKSSGGYAKFSTPFWCYAVVDDFASLLDPPSLHYYADGHKVMEMTAAVTSNAVSPNCGFGAGCTCEAGVRCKDSSSNQQPICRVDPRNVTCGGGDGSQWENNPAYIHPDGYVTPTKLATACKGHSPLVSNLQQNSGSCQSAMGATRTKDSGGYFNPNFAPFATSICTPNEGAQKVGASFRSVCSKVQLRWTAHGWGGYDAETLGIVTHQPEYKRGLIAASLCMLSKVVECFTLPTAAECTTKKTAACKETCFPTSSYRSHPGNCAQLGGDSYSLSGGMINTHTGGGGFKNAMYCCFKDCIIPDNGPNFMLWMAADNSFCATPTKVF